MPFSQDSFMQPFVKYGEWVEIDGGAGITFVPGDIFTSDFLETVRKSEEVTDEIIEEVRDYYESSTIYSVTITEGFGARMSPPRIHGLHGMVCVRYRSRSRRVS